MTVAVDSDKNEKSKAENNEVEGQDDPEKKRPYPKAVFFIVVNEFCERFCYYGMRTILSLYLVNILLYSEPDSKIIYHTFTMFVYFFPTLGAIISDNWLGKFRTVFYLSIVYAIGNVILALAAAEPIGLPQVEFSLLGLLLIAVGTGGIKPCVAAFGGDQFHLPQQAIQLAAFFSMFYFSINAGSLISTFLTPILREDVKCFDADSCYPLAFAVPGILMIIAIVVFVLGRPLYKIVEPEGNVLVKVCKCIGHAIKRKFKSEKKVDHWMDHAEEKYGKHLVEDVKKLLRVLVIYIPLPIFWALYDQQGSGWTFQAVRMDGDVGFYTILPDQMQLVNPLLILIFIPCFTYGIYPLLSKIRLVRTPLQKMVSGGVLVAIAFAISAIVSLQLESTYPVLPEAGESQLRFYNPTKCDMTLRSAVLPENLVLSSMGYKQINIKITGSKEYDYTLEATSCNPETTGKLRVKEEETTGFYFRQSDEFLRQYKDDIEKNSEGSPNFRVLIGDDDDNTQITFIKGDKKVTVPAGNHSIMTIDPGIYKIKDYNKEVEFNLGGVYSLLINTENSTTNFFEITEANSVHMLWLLPQYIVITAGEIMFSITGVEFSYSQAPKSMKSVLQAMWLLTTAIGNLVIVIIESAKIFEKQSLNFFLYTGLMVLDLLLFAFLAYRYKYVKNEDSEGEQLEERKEKDNNAIDNPAFQKSDDQK